MSGEAASLGAAYRRLRDAFRAAGLAEADLDARLLVAEAAGIEPSRLIVEERRPLDAGARERLAQFEKARLARMPVGRILGRRSFWGLDFALAPETLEPRPDTEILVEAVLDDIDRHGMRDAPLVFADLGTGTGAILVALLSELPNAYGVGTDLSVEALRTARRNAAANGVGDRAGFVRCSYARALAARGRDGFDFIVSNPPYIRDEVVAGLAPEVREHDPLLALSGGADGLDAYRAIAPQAAARLQSSGGVLHLEIGYDQAASVEAICKAAGFASVTLRQDLGGLDRVVSAAM